MIEGRPDPSLVLTVESRVPLATVRAGSALLALEDQFLVLGDDAHAVTWFDPVSGTERHEPFVGDGRALTKAHKPDFEAAAAAPDGTVWLFGSGSLPGRRLVVRLGQGSVGAVPFEDAALFDAVEDNLQGTPNIEGALFLGATLRLFHRGVGDEPDRWFDIADLATPRVVASETLTFGALDGVPLHLTDAALTEDGTVAFLAAAELTDDPVLDGEVVGTVFGFLAADEARWAPLTTEKAEGLVVVPGGGWFVTDSDDADSGADLCRFRVT